MQPADNEQVTRAVENARQRYRETGTLTDDMLREASTCGRPEEALSPGEREYLALHRPRYRRTLELLPDGNGRRLLDVGCFPGHLALLARIKGWEVSALSLPGARWGDPGFEARMAAAGIAVQAADVQAQAFPFADGLFDAAFFNETIEHLTFNPFHPLKESWRVLRPNGLLIFSVPNLCRFDHRWAMLRGCSFYLDLRNPLAATFPVDIANRHIREYTAAEVRYLLEEQDKYLYHFRVDDLIMDRSWDSRYCRSDGIVRDRRRVTRETLLRDVLTRFVKSLRGNILVRARKPADYFLLEPAAISATGFLPPEETGSGPGFVREPVRVNWMTGPAELRLQPPAGKLRHIDLLVCLPAPVLVAPRRLTVQVNGRPALAVDIGPSPEPRRIRIPAELNLSAGSEVVLSLDCPLWRPSAYGLADDQRLLGLMVAAGTIGVGLEPA